MAVSARTVPELRGTVDSCRKSGVRAVEAACDVTDTARVGAAHRALTVELGAPTILVNAAGLARGAPFLKTTPEFMETLWRLNVMGTFHCTKAALPHMLETGWGRVVNIASVAGLVGSPHIAAYAASKHAVVGLTRSLASEFGAKGITINAVCPGYVNTRMTHENVDAIVKATGRSREEILGRIAAMNPQGRLIEPEEVASVVVRLVQPEASGVNGQAIPIDGGALKW